MRKVLILRRIEMQKVCNFYTENQDIFTTDEYAKSVFTQIINNNAIISKLIIENDASTKPITKKKNEVFSILRKQTYQIADILTGYGYFVNFEPFSKIQGCSKPVLSRSRESEVILHAQKLVTIINKNVTQSIAAGITQQHVTKLKTAINQALIMQPQPYNLKLKHKQTTIQINQIIKWYNGIMKNTLAPLMQSRYAETHPEQYKSFIRAISTATPLRRKRCIAGKITDRYGNSLRNVTIQVNGKYMGKHGGKTGYYYITNLQPGVHKLIFNLQSYKIYHTTVITHPETTEQLNIMLESVEVPEPQTV